MLMPTAEAAAAIIVFRWIVTISLSLGGVAAISYRLSLIEAARPQGVIVTSPVTLRDGDGEQFDEVAAVAHAVGQTVAVLGHRGDWTRVVLSEGTTGWLPRASVDAYTED